MNPGLNGQRIILFESRLADELSAMVRRSGGEPVCVPALREVRRPAGAQVAALLDRMGQEAAPIFVLFTGVGTKALFEEARALGRGKELHDALQRGITVCRGPKPVAALHREGLAASLKAVAPWTTTELIAALRTQEVEQREVLLLHYGERNHEVAEELQRRGARLSELLLYEWEPAEDPAPLARAVEELIDGRFAAAAFTSQIQGRYLVAAADKAGLRAALLDAFRTRTVVAAVGPTCARALEKLGVPVHVEPDMPKMGPMLTALIGHLTAKASPA
jgi:uroporphyrinogen-III synthase